MGERERYRRSCEAGPSERGRQEPIKDSIEETGEQSLF